MAKRPGYKCSKIAVALLLFSTRSIIKREQSLRVRSREACVFIFEVVVGEATVLKISVVFFFELSEKKTSSDSQNVWRSLSLDLVIKLT